MPPSGGLLVGNQIKGLIPDEGWFQIPLGEPGLPCPELAEERVCGPHPTPQITAVKGPFVTGRGQTPVTMLSCQKGLLELPRGGQLYGAEQKEGSDSVVVSVARWTPWRRSRFRAWLDHGRLTQAHQARTQGTGMSPSLRHASPKVGERWAAGWGRARHSSLARESRASREDVTARMKFKSAVPGDSRLPVILKLSASHIWEVLLNMDLLDGLWSGLISSSLQSV